MRRAWARPLLSQYLWRDRYSEYWRSSALMESYLHAAVRPAAFREEYLLWRANTTYSDANWLRDTYPDWYLGFYVPLYASSLQRALLRLAPGEGRARVRVLDVGVGIGTTALALADLTQVTESLGLVPALELELVCIERDATKIEEAQRVVDRFVRELDSSVRSRLTGAFVDPDQWRLVDLGKTVGALGSREFDLIVLGNVLTELQRQFGGEPRRSLMKELVPNHLVAGGLVLASEPGYEGSDALAASLCTAKAELSEAGVVPVGPCQETRNRCDRPTMNECRCGQPFTLEWPDYYFNLTAGEQDRHRTVRSLWLALGRPKPGGPEIQGLVCDEECDVLTTVDVPAAAFLCPRCAGPTRPCVSDEHQFLGCVDIPMCSSVTETDGTASVPYELSRTRVNKLALGSAVAEEAAREWREQEQRLLDAATDFGFRVGDLYTNGLHQYLVVGVPPNTEAGFVIVERQDTGTLSRLRQSVAADRYLVSRIDAGAHS